MTSEEKRAALADKIEAGEKRNEERTLAESARNAAGSAADFVKQHPIATVSGAVVAGLAIGAMTRPGRRTAKKVAKRGGVLATLASEAVLAFGIKLIDQATDTARAGQDRLEDLGDSLTTSAQSAKREAGYRIGKASDATSAAGRTASRKAGRVVRGLRERLNS